MPAPRYSWAGGESGPGSAGTTPVYEGGHEAPHLPAISSGENTPQHESVHGEAEAGDQEEEDEVEAEICLGYNENQSSDNKK